MDAQLPENQAAEHAGRGVKSFAAGFRFRTDHREINIRVRIVRRDFAAGHE